MKLRRAFACLLALLLVGLVTGCPDREEVTQKVGGAPARTLERTRKALQRAQDQAAQRLKAADERMKEAGED